MYQKDLAKRAWTEAGLYRSNDPKLLEFLSKQTVVGQPPPR